MPFPRISTAYKCDVAANFEEHGYTLAYQENYDKAQGGCTIGTHSAALSSLALTGKLLTKGRFLPSNTFEMIDQKTNWLYQWSGDGSDCKSCTCACIRSCIVRGRSHHWVLQTTSLRRAGSRR
jgi:hypothetical protein